MDLTTMIDGGQTIISGLLMFTGGAFIILKWIAPRTKTLWDDKLYAYVEKAQVFLSASDKAAKKLNVAIKKKK